jgi:nicotinate-nucleotide--dimethylbenzimidazole phosphoribosyltransferase
LNTIETTVAAIPRRSEETIGQALRERWDSLTKPRGSLGVLEDAVVRLGEIQNTAMPSVARRGLYVFCGDHGITQEGVSLYPSVVTQEMVKNFVRGGAAINVLCRQLGIETTIVDAGVDGPRFDGQGFEGVVDRRVGNGTRSFLRSTAMAREDAEKAIATGIGLAADASARFDLVGVGEMGIGNTTSASAILCALAGSTPEEAAGRGTGLDDAGVQRKREVLKAAIALHEVNPSDDPLSVVSAFGGFEIAMMAGFILGCAAHRLPVVVDGFISSAAFLIARAFCPTIGEFVFFGHRSAEWAHARLLAEVGAKPLLDLGLRLGEGTGAALAMGVLTSAVSLYREMATFAEASVSDIATKE